MLTIKPTVVVVFFFFSFFFISLPACNTVVDGVFAQRLSNMLRVSQGRVCSDNRTCCHTETEVWHGMLIYSK